MTARLAALSCFLGALVVDRITKTAAVSYLNHGDPVSFFFGSLNFHLVENHSGFLGYYGFLPETLKDTLLTWGTGTLILLLLLYLVRQKGLCLYRQSAISLILAGGVGNLADRLINKGGVIDFIIIAFGPFQTGIFNLADVFILLGSVYLGSSLASSGK